MSTAITRAAGKAWAMATAMQPLPVPRSHTSAGRRPIAATTVSTNNSVSGRGIRTAGVTANESDQNSRTPVT